MQSAIGTLFAILHSQGLFYLVGFVNGGPGSSVGIVTAYGLDGPGIESRWGEIFRTSPDWP